MLLSAMVSDTRCNIFKMMTVVLLLIIPIIDIIRAFVPVRSWCYVKKYNTNDRTRTDSDYNGCEDCCRRM